MPVCCSQGEGFFISGKYEINRTHAEREARHLLYGDVFPCEKTIECYENNNANGQDRVDLAYGKQPENVEVEYERDEVEKDT